MALLFLLFGLFWASNESIAKDDGYEVIQGKPITTGFVIINGSYINPPYIVMRREFNIFINESKVPVPVRYPGEKPLFDDLKSDPNLIDEWIKLLETARQVYEKDLSAGYAYVFNNEGHRTFDPYTIAYNTPIEIEQVQINNPSLTLRIKQLAETLFNVEEFGNTSGKDVNDGFVFIDGQYIQAPYKVNRKGLGLFINGVMIAVPCHWEVPKTVKALVVTEDPERPLSIHKYSSRYDPDIREYLGKKKVYYVQKYGKDATIAHMQKTYEQLPCVQSSHIDSNDPQLLVVKWYGDTENAVRLFPPDGRSLGQLTKSDMLKRLEQERETLEKRLAMGDYYFFFTEGSKITGGKESAREMLPKAVNIFESNNSIDKKINDLKEIGFPIVQTKKFETMLKEFSVQPQLHQRLNALSTKKN